ncbi:hypothetical protein Dxin01_01941 [Deinococcus xinjiangensis]|uniref:DNA methyltransferase n=1 Tax=Deinococcus xinjiangensis TaxID=457454 RepID=A0ABP9VAD5_9DEIO
MEPTALLVRAVERAQSAEVLGVPPSVQAEVQRVVNCASNRAPARLILACALAKAHQPQFDATEPYTEIRSGHSFSGRSYDERYITALITAHRLPLNPTTAFLTPTLRNANEPIRSAIPFEGRPREVYRDAASILEAIQSGEVAAEDVLALTLRQLFSLRDERESALAQALSGIISPNRSLSTEDVLTLLEQHLRSRNASRLPVLLVAALYQTLGQMAGEKALNLGAHNAADSQTGALGDVEVELLSDLGRIVTVYEVKARSVSINDLQQAVAKVAAAASRPENYLFVTTHPIEREVTDYARTLHEQTGVEFAVLDALSFARHLLHFFHRYRLIFLDAYQELLLAEPPSAVRPELKTAWLALRSAAES